MRDPELPESTGLRGAAIEALWSGVRLAVVDTETTVVNDDEWAAVSIGLVSCRNGIVGSKWQELLNPGVSVDHESAAIHHLNDSVLRGAPRFAQVADLVRNWLTPANPDETVVLAAFSVGFDVGVLRTEFERLGQTMPEVRVLDVRGALPTYVGVKPQGRKLSDLCEALGIPLVRPHDAMADAVACAEAAVELLNRAAIQGERDFAALLDEVTGGDTTLTIAGVPPSVVRKNRRNTVVIPELPAQHAESHSTVLSPRAGKRLLAAWRKDVAECARLRCPLLADRVETAGRRPEILLPELEAVLEERVLAQDNAGVATVLGAMTSVLPAIATGQSSRTKRNTALSWNLRWEPLLTPLAHCSTTDPCPHCQRREPCPLDTWPDTVGVIARGPFPDKRTQADDLARSFLVVNGKDRGTGPFVTWRKKPEHNRIADAALWSVVEYSLANRNAGHADQVVMLAWDLGCRHPDVAERCCRLLSIAGDEPSLTAAVEVAREALGSEGESTHPGWHRLRARYRSVKGRLDRLAFRHSGDFDDDGNPIPLRIHHPAEPKRPPLRRFQRQ